MKIGVMSDTHLSRVTTRLRKIVEEIFNDADMMLHAGDIVSGEVLAYLEGHGVLAVRGNMDWADPATSLPVKRVVRAGEFELGLIHGHGAPGGLAERLRPEFGQIDCMIFGHSHRAEIRRVQDELWFNPGSASESRGRGGPSVGFLHLGNRIEAEIMELD